MFSPLAADLARFIEKMPAYTECSVPQPFSKDSTQDCRLEPFPPQPTSTNSILATYMERNKHPRVSTIVTLPETMAKVRDNIIETHALHIDTFGNVVLALSAPEWRKRMQGAGELTLYTQATRPLKLVSAYQELNPEQVGIICGSQGYLELACYMCSAAETINIKLGDTIKIACSIPPEK